jgi:DNA-binding NtrC family response regulator
MHIDVKQIAGLAQQPGSIFISALDWTARDLSGRLLHALSPACRGPFVTLRVLPRGRNPWAAELEGHAMAVLRRRFRLAAGGTLYVDDVADLSEGLQRALFDLLSIEADSPATSVRIVAGSAADGTALLADGFDPALFYRLNRLHLAAPDPAAGLADALADPRRHVVPSAAAWFTSGR